MPLSLTSTCGKLLRKKNTNSIYTTCDRCNINRIKSKDHDEKLMLVFPDHWELYGFLDTFCVGSTQKVGNMLKIFWVLALSGINPINPKGGQ